jgi:hypothetical protein
MTSISSSNVWRACLLTVALSAVVSSQIAQDHPELCGTPKEVVLLPPNITAVPVGAASSELTIRLSHGLVKIEMTGISEVQQVCPVGQNLLLVFSVPGSGIYDIKIINQETGAMLDSILAYDPLVSPDQRWLVYRDFYPPQSQVSLSEEYLLYDLDKDAKANRLTNPDSGQVEAAGRVIYPAVRNAVPFDNLGLPREQRHTFRATSFFWAKDSKSLIFADESGGALSIIWLKIDPEDRPTAYVHPVIGTDICRNAQANQSSGPLTLANAFVGDGQDGSPEVHVDFQSNEAACSPKATVLPARGFRRAEIEHHAPPVRRRPAVKKKVE